jgi:hypothetical protein
MKDFDQYGPKGVGPFASPKETIDRLVEMFDLPMKLNGGEVHHMGNGVYRPKYPKEVVISSSEGLYELLYGSMNGAVRLFTVDRKILIIGCSPVHEWVVA